MNQSGSLNQLIRRARRRHLANVVLRQGVVAVCAAISALILLLLLGTQILDWWWVAVLFAGGLAVGLWNLPRQIPSQYRVAQWIDRRTGLSDALSTAFFYSRPDPNRHISEELRAAQFAEAERLAREVPLDRAAPIRAPRSLYAMAALLLAASGLLTLRYGIFRSLDLRPPIASIALDSFHFIAKAEKPDPEKPKTKDKRLNELLKEYGLTLENQSQNKPAQDDSKDTAGSQSAESQSKEGEKQEASQEPDQADRQRNSGESADGASEGQPDQTAATRRDPRDNSAEASQSQQAANSQSENNSLLDKFKDAMQNLLSRLKTQPKSGDMQQQAANSQQGRSEMGEPREMQGQKGSQQAGAKQQQGAQANGQPQGEQRGEGNEKAQGGPGKQSGSHSQEASQQGKSGIGKEDGSKDLKEAEQLAAMGKISEIIGRRSQNLTGNAMVEVAPGKQQLRTGYSQQSATHTEAGGAINRDEVPLAYQRYVQQYFEEIRKAPPARTDPGR